jgi:hypothetical protein
MEYELHGDIKTETVITPTAGAAAGASTVGAVVDTLGFNSLEYVVSAGTITTGDFTATLEQSPDDGTGSPTGVWTAVPSDLVLGTGIAFAVADDDVTQRVGIIGKERHQRFTLVGANTPVADMCVIAVLGNSYTQPTAE